MLSLREKVRGLFLGIGIGDALGMAVETMTPEQIHEKYKIDRVTDYLTPTGHKWFNDHAPGTVTDDTQLSLAVAQGIINSKGALNMDTQVQTHVEAMKRTTAGWGGTTREAVCALANGASYTRSGISGAKRGKGNGCAMKIAPLAVNVVNYHKKHPELSMEDHKRFMMTVYTFSMRLCLMTHGTTLGVQSGIVQQVAATYCLSPFCDFEDGEQFDDNQFIFLLLESAAYAAQLVQGNRHAIDVDKETDFVEQLDKLHNYTEYDPARCRAEFGGGSCYISHSLPFTYMFFLRNPFSIDSLYDIISAGGDADSNGSMLGALLGALNGPTIFPQHLIEGLVERDGILAVAEQFCDVLGVK